MDCSRSFAIATINLYYFVFIGLSFGDTNKRRELPYSIFFLLYPLRPSLTIVMQLQLTNKQKAILLNVYATTTTHSEEFKDRFYEKLDTPVAAVTKSEKKIINTISQSVSQSVKAYGVN